MASAGVKCRRFDLYPDLQQGGNGIPQLHEFLIRAGLSDKRGNDEFIIAPEEKMKREIMALHTSRAFSHYFKKIGGKRHLTFHSLRRTYLTGLTEKYGPETAKLIGGHSSISVMQNHYLNPVTISLIGKDFEVFNQKKERENELKKNKKQERKISLNR